jgi:multiple sugar transport system ATP-binding protein
MAEVVLEHVGKTFPNGVRAVHDLSLTVADGELIVLVGPSGCGKTTTLRLIAGLEAPTTGTIRIAGRVVNGTPPHRRDTAMVFQRPALYPHLNVRDNLGFGFVLRQGFWQGFWGTKRAERRERVGRAARLLQLTDLLDRRPQELSGGQQQRAALGRALVREPAVFLLDEPLSNLDARLRMEMRRELHLLHRRLRATMVYVTHDQEEALSLGDRVVLLDRGEIQQADRPQVLYDRPANRTAAAFIGWPPMNFLEGRLIEQDGRLLLAAGDATLSLDERRDEWRGFAGRGVAVGVRPEHVRVAPRRGGLGDGVSLLMQDIVADPMRDHGADAPRSPGSAEVRLVERAGPFCLATVRYGNWTVTARIDGPAPAIGSLVGLEFALVQAHLFERETGRVLSSARSANGADDGFRRP